VSTRRRKLPSRWKRFRYRLEGLFWSCWRPDSFAEPKDTGETYERRRLAGVSSDGAGAAHCTDEPGHPFGQSKSQEEKPAHHLLGLSNVCGAVSSACFGSRPTQPANARYVVEVDTESLQLLRKHGRAARELFSSHSIMANGNCSVGHGAARLPLTIVTEHTPQSPRDRIFERLRRERGQPHHLQRNAVTKLFKALKRGEYVALLIDLMPCRAGAGSG